MRFPVEPGGYAMTIITTGYRSDADTAFAAAMKSMVGTSVRFHLSAGGVPERVSDGAASWNAMLVALRVQIATYGAESPARAPATRMLVAMADPLR